MLVDLTLPVNEDTIILPNDRDFEPFESETIASIEQGHELAVHKFCQHTHLGTHTDSPAHYVADGKTIDDIDLEALSGSAIVVDLRDWQGEFITAEILEEATPELSGGERLLLVTRDVDRYFHEADEPDIETFFREASALSVDGAEWLIENEVSFIANDFVTESVDVPDGKPFDPDRPVHNALCEAGIPIGEYLCNTGPVVDHEAVELHCLPHPISDFEAGPSRVIANI